MVAEMDGACQLIIGNDVFQGSRKDGNPLQYLAKWENAHTHRWEFWVRAADGDIIFPVSCIRKEEQYAMVNDRQYKS